MIAELRGKISSTGSNLSDRLEDQLTSDFFGSLRYISFEIAMKPILKKTKMMGSDTLDILNKISHIEAGYWADNISFWPSNRLGEFDVILEFKELIIGIEVKLYSGLSSDDDVDETRTDEEEQSCNQLSRESRILKEKMQYTNKPAVLIFIAPENKCKSICRNVYERNIIENGVALGYLSWEEILEEMKQIRSNEGLDQVEKLIITDLMLLLRRKGLERFKDFKFRCEKIDSGLWFQFEEKIENTIKYNDSKTICKEGYYEFR